MPGISNANARSTTIDTFLATVADNVQEALSDAIGRSCPTVAEMPKETWDGGRTIDVDLMYDFSTGFSGVKPWDKLNIVGSDGITQAQFPCKELHQPIAIAGPDIRANAGKGKLKDLVKTKFAQATMTQQNKFSQLMFDTVAANKALATANTGVNPYGFPVLIAHSASYYPGGITPSGTGAFWLNPSLAYDETTECAAATTYKTFLDKIDAAGMLAAKYMGGLPNRGCCDLRTYRTVIRALRNMQQIVEAKTGASGFESIAINTLGGLKLFYEEHMSDEYTEVNYDSGSFAKGTIFFWNTKFVKLMVRSGMDWKVSPFKDLLPWQDVYASAALWEGNVVVTNRLKNSVLYKIDYSLAS